MSTMREYANATRAVKPLPCALPPLLGREREKITVIGKCRVGFLKIVHVQDVPFFLFAFPFRSQLLIENEGPAASLSMDSGTADKKA